MTARAAVALVALAALASGGCLKEALGGGDIGPRDLLRDSDYTAWVIEVDYAQGERPSDAVLDLLRTRMESLVHKPDGVEVRLDEELAREERVWGEAALRNLRAQHQGAETGGRTVVTHLSFLAGSSSADDGDGRVLGLALGHDQVAIFSQTVKESCTLTTLPPCLYTDDEILRAVVVHEFGHILGLVDNGIPMQADHKDEAHGAHSDNPDSVMYWAVETTDFVQFFTDGLPTQFDADDRADTRAAGGK